MYTHSPERPPPHPAKAVLVDRRITGKTLAIELGVHQMHVYAVLNRRKTATPRFREGVSKFLGLPESELFHPDPKQQSR